MRQSSISADPAGAPGGVGGPMGWTPAAASLGVADVLMGVPRPWRVLGRSRRAWWCESNGDVVVLATAGAAALPNALVMAGARVEAPSLARDVVEIGAGAVTAPGLEVRVVRWWDPRVSSPSQSPGVIGRRVAAASRMVHLAPLRSIAEAIGSHDVGRFLDAAGRLVGRGEGLTPEGDDHLVGFLAGYRHVAASLGDADALVRFAAATGPLLADARLRTTTFAWCLLRHATRGEVPSPLGALLSAISGGPGLERALLATMAMGHSSGPAMAAGAVAGAGAALGGAA